MKISYEIDLSKKDYKLLSELKPGSFFLYDYEPFILLDFEDMADNVPLQGGLPALNIRHHTIIGISKNDSVIQFDEIKLI